MRRPGALRVTQPSGMKNKPDLLRRDLDNEEWTYEWLNRNGLTILRLTRDADDKSGIYEFLEFSSPVNIEFIRDY